jgi:hypothetical protein
LTLETAGAFFAGAVFLASDLGGAFFPLAIERAAVFFAGRSFKGFLAFAGFACFAGFREAVFAAVARFALGFAAFAFTGRFAVFADRPRLADRDEDRRRPFVRLLLICRLLMAAYRGLSSR